MAASLLALDLNRVGAEIGAGWSTPNLPQLRSSAVASTITPWPWQDPLVSLEDDLKA